MPSPVLAPSRGRWLWTCRAGFETHLFEELAWAGGQPRLVGPALVESTSPKQPPAFARMGFPVAAVVGAPLEGAVEEIAARLKQAAGGAPMHVQVWAPDADAYAPLHTLARAHAEALETALRAQEDAARVRRAGEGQRAEQGIGGSAQEASARENAAPRLLLATAEEARARGGALAQVCLLSPALAAVGVVRAAEAWSLSAGGRQRMWREAGPSRAALKLEEALALSAIAPERGETCVDLGAAPGGWTQRLLQRGARVIAVDPAKLAPDLMKNPKLRHVQDSAFAFEPDEPVDWLFCDMAWRPLEVAQLLAKWARRGWADALVANLKLPMKDKNPIVFRARHLLEAAGWKGLTIRQLYHDRDEVTVIARRR